MAKDPIFPNSNSSNADAVIGLASPKDRLAAYILDCTLLLPLVQLVQSPIKKWILESVLFDEGANLSSLRVVNLAIFILLFIFYYTVMIAWRGQTLGKMFFAVKVISYNGKLGVVDSFLRSISIFFEFVAFGIPFTSIFSHPMRRPIHDRVADTLVISERNPVGFPSRKERWGAQWVSGVMSFILGVSVLNYALTDSKSSVAALDAEEACERAINRVESQLEKVYELHLLGEISTECLHGVARDNLWQSDSKALAQFAMAMSLRDDFAKSKDYLETLCEENSNHHLCDLSRWVLTAPEVQRQQFTSLTKKLKTKSPYNFVRVYLAAHMNNNRNYRGAERILSPIERPGLLEPVVGSLTFHSLLGQLKWEEAYWVAKTHGQVGDSNILYFMQMELRKSQLSIQQQLQLLDYFYPDLSEKSSRLPASVKGIPSEIRDIYNILEGRL